MSLRVWSLVHLWIYAKSSGNPLETKRICLCKFVDARVPWWDIIQMLPENYDTPLDIDEIKHPGFVTLEHIDQLFPSLKVLEIGMPIEYALDYMRDHLEEARTSVVD